MRISRSQRPRRPRTPAEPNLRLHGRQRSSKARPRHSRALIQAEDSWPLPLRRRHPRRRLVALYTTTTPHDLRKAYCLLNQPHPGPAFLCFFWVCLPVARTIQGVFAFSSALPSTKMLFSLLPLLLFVWLAKSEQLRTFAFPRCKITQWRGGRERVQKL